MDFTTKKDHSLLKQPGIARDSTCRKSKGNEISKISMEFTKEKSAIDHPSKGPRDDSWENPCVTPHGPGVGSLVADVP